MGTLLRIGCDWVTISGSLSLLNPAKAFGLTKALLFAADEVIEYARPYVRFWHKADLRIVSQPVTKIRSL